MEGESLEAAFGASDHRTLCGGEGAALPVHLMAQLGEPWGARVAASYGPLVSVLPEAAPAVRRGSGQANAGDIKM